MFETATHIIDFKVFNVIVYKLKPEMSMHGLLTALTEGESEFKQFLDTLRRLGIKHSINYGPTKKDWQGTIIRAGFNITALACTVITVGSLEYLFCNGQLVWDDQERGYGPSGLLMFSRDKKTKRITERVYMDHHNAGGKIVARGLGAIRATYSNYEWGPSKEMAFY